MFWNSSIFCESRSLTQLNVNLPDRTIMAGMWKVRWIGHDRTSHTSQLSPAQACTASADPSGTFRTHLKPSGPMANLIANFVVPLVKSMKIPLEYVWAIPAISTIFVTTMLLYIYCRCNTIYIYNYIYIIYIIIIVKLNQMAKQPSSSIISVHSWLDLSQDDVPKAGPPAAGSSRKRPRTFSARCGLDSGDVQRISWKKWVSKSMDFYGFPTNFQVPNPFCTFW